MPRNQRFADYIQRLAYEALFQPEERDEWPEELLPRAPEVSPNYAAWSATSFSSYVPFRVR